MTRRRRTTSLTRARRASIRSARYSSSTGAEHSTSTWWHTCSTRSTTSRCRSPSITTISPSACTLRRAQSRPSRLTDASVRICVNAETVEKHHGVRLCPGPHLARYRRVHVGVDELLSVKRTGYVRPPDGDGDRYV